MITNDLQTILIVATNTKTFSRYGAVLKKRRNDLGLTMQDVVRLTGLSEPSIVRMESGSRPTYYRLKKYVIALGGTLEINFPDIPSYKEQKKIDKKKEEFNPDFDYNLPQ